MPAIRLPATLPENDEPTGFVLTSTAIVMQMLEERGDLSAPKGQRIVSILLLEDFAIVPLLALVAFLAPGGEDVTLADRAIGIGLGAIAALILAGRYLLNPVFSLLAAAQAREVMTAAALLIVLGAALWMQVGGLSAALSVGLISAEENATLTAIIILSMVMTPLFIILHDRLMPTRGVSADGLPAPEDDGSAVLLIGFGRFGQVVSQPLLRMGHRLTIIDTDPEGITAATRSN